MQVLAIDIGGTNVKLCVPEIRNEESFVRSEFDAQAVRQGDQSATQGWSYDAVTVGCRLRLPMAVH